MMRTVSVCVFAFATVIGRPPRPAPPGRRIVAQARPDRPLRSRTVKARGRLLDKEGPHGGTAKVPPRPNAAKIGHFHLDSRAVQRRVPRASRSRGAEN